MQTPPHPEDETFHDEIQALGRRIVDAIAVLPATPYNTKIILAALALTAANVIELSDPANVAYFLEWLGATDYYSQ
jgi:hypothetical protein